MVKAPFWYVGPSYGAAKRTVWDDPRMLPLYIPEWNNPDSKIIKKRETELRIDFLSSGGQIYVFGSDRPDLMRGPNPFGVVLDEFSVMRGEVWDDVIQPIMRANPQAWCWFLFTPQGQNHAHKVFQFGQRGDNEWKSWKLTAEESGIFTPEQLENARRDMSEMTFQQELMCEFLQDSGIVFRGIKNVIDAQTPTEPKLNHRYIMGVDLARLRDWTVITVFDAGSNKQVYYARFNKLDWGMQKARIAETSRHFNNCMVAIDGSGLGDPIVQDLARMSIPVQPFIFTNTSKQELIEKLATWIETKKIRLLNIPEQTNELATFSYEISESTGRVRYNAPQGLTDDIVISLALAVWYLNPVTKEKQDSSESLMHQAKLRAFAGQLDPMGEVRDSELNEWGAY